MKMKEIKIFPSLLAANAGKLQEEIDRMDAVSDAIHFDVMDGNFVPNLTFGAPVLECLSTKNFFDAHLMVQNPDSLIPDFAKAGAKSISVHFETCPNLHRTLQLIRLCGAKAGVVLNPATSFEAACDAIAFADFVLVMGVNPGFGGQNFIPEVLEKVKKIRKNFPEKDIQIDGGMNEKTAPMAIEAGANWIVAGSYLFSAENLEEAAKKLKVQKSEASDIQIT